MKADLLPALADGRLRPVIDHVFPLTEALEARMRRSARSCSAPSRVEVRSPTLTGSTLRLFTGETVSAGSIKEGT
jgi:hypothetical protein